MKKIFYCYCFFFISCNYNFYLGKKLEGEKKFEEANIEYSRAYLQNSSNKKYEEAYKNNAEKVAIVFKERYQQKIKEKKFPDAYKVLGKALELKTNNSFFLTESKKWQSILLAGKVLYPKGGDLEGLFIGKKIYPVISFNSPFSSQKIEGVIDIEGSFAVEDIVYQITPKNYLEYTVELIGFKYLPFREKNFSAKDNFIYYNLVQFDKPTLLTHQGDFNIQEYYNPIKEREFGASQFNEYWYPQKNITYSSKLDKNKIIIESSTKRISFLPLYISIQEKNSFLDFGTFDFKKKQNSFLWGITRKKEDKSYLDSLIKNYYYLKYFKNKSQQYSLILK